MAIELNGKTIETTPTGYLVDIADWGEDLAKLIAAEEELALTEKHWDLMNYLRDEFINNGGNQPNTRAIIKAMADKWGSKPTQKDLYELFPNDPSKQGGRIASNSRLSQKRTKIQAYRCFQNKDFVNSVILMS